MGIAISIAQMVRLARGKILVYLARIYPASATLALLQLALLEDGMGESLNDIKIHLCFLAARGYVKYHNLGSLPLAVLTERGQQIVDSCSAAEFEIL